MGVVYHANYVVWMEVARVEALRSVGIVYAEMEREGFLVAVVGVNVEYKAAAKYDEVVEVTARVVELQSRMMKLSYEMKRASDGTVLALGETKHLFVSRELRPVRLPEKYRAAFLGQPVS